MTDTSPGIPITPSGTVTFSSSGSGLFSSVGCTLSGGGSKASCYVTFTPTSKGFYTLVASYVGDADHLPNSKSITFKTS